MAYHRVGARRGVCLEAARGYALPTKNVSSEILGQDSLIGVVFLTLVGTLGEPIDGKKGFLDQR